LSFNHRLPYNELAQSSESLTIGDTMPQTKIILTSTNQVIEVQIHVGDRLISTQYFEPAFGQSINSLLNDLASDLINQFDFDDSLSIEYETLDFDDQPILFHHYSLVA
jgi:hypothetical protein